MIGDGKILALQLSASLLMGADYFFDENQRGKINTWLHRWLNFFHEVAGREINGATNIANRKKLLMIGILIAYPVIFLTAIEIGDHMSAHRQGGWLGNSIFAFFMILTTALLALFMKPFIKGPVALVGFWFFKAIIKFVVRCPKGSIFGIGFILLLSSFVCRYLNLK